MSPFNSHRGPFGFKQEVQQDAKYHRRMAAKWKSKAAAVYRSGPPNLELRALSLKIAAFYLEVAEFIEQRLFKEW